MTMSDEIRKCTRCIDLKLVSYDKLNADQKPYVQFDVERSWKPGKVDVLFVAESPPWNGKQRYFYNPVAEKRINLRTEVLSRLNLNKLEVFNERGYFLIDTIKCRLNKSIKKKVLYRIAKTCSQRFLLKEIKQLKPNTVFILGNTAKYALEQTADFEELVQHRITQDYDTNLSGYRVIVCPFPGGLTRKWTNEIDSAFMKIR